MAKVNAPPWTTAGGGSGSSAIPIVFTPPAVQIGGDITLQSPTNDGSGAWVEVAAATGGPGTGNLDLTLTGVTAGDVVEIGVTARAVNVPNVFICFNFATMVGGTQTNFVYQWTSAFSEGIGLNVGWASNLIPPLYATIPYTVLSGDLSSGSLTIRPVYKTVLAGSRILGRAQNRPLIFSLKNYKH